MPSTIESQIKDRITAFVTELDQLVRKSTLDALHGILAGGGAIPSPKRRGRPARIVRGPGRPRGRRPADLGDATGKVLDFVKANDGQGISAIAGATGLDLAVAKKAAGQLLAAGQLKKSGAKRGTVYHVGSGKPARAAKAKKAGKRRGRKAKKAKAA
ncbi:MAG TPA: hypothetical protein VF414_19920 [Thermoanaerobaculia bacterium]